MGRNQARVDTERNVTVKVYSFRKFTETERKRFDKTRAELAPRVKEQVEAIDASQTLSVADFSVTINAR